MKYGIVYFNKFTNSGVNFQNILLSSILYGFHPMYVITEKVLLHSKLKFCENVPLALLLFRVFSIINCNTTSFSVGVY